jgi:hypothetical protein
VVAIGVGACSDDEGGAQPGSAGGDAGASGGGAGQGGSSAGGTGGSGASSATGGAGGAGGVGGSSSGGSSSGGGAGAGGAGAPGVECPALSPPTGSVVHVTAAQAGELPNVVFNAPAGTTFLLEDGTYALASGLQLAKPGMVLRSASNDAARVIVDGGFQVDETIAVSASDVTIAHITVERAIHHPIHVYTPASGTDVTGTRIYGVTIIDGGQQFVKVNPGTTGGWVDEGAVECSSFKMTDAGRAQVVDCYTGGIDVHAGWNWVVRNNRFEDIYCTTGQIAEHAVHFWRGARGTLVENNVIVNCARGIGFGLDGGVGVRDYPDTPNGGVKLAHYDGIIRNNVVFADIAWFDSGIELAIAKRPVVVHNTIIAAATATNFFSSIDYRFAETDAFIANNLTTRITQRDGASGTLQNNLEQTPLAVFVNAAALDFHLSASATSAIDQGVDTGQGGVDMDGQTHDVGVPDIGADEVSP